MVERTGTYLVGKHLSPDYSRQHIEKCAVCGAKDVPGYNINDVIGPSFMDWDAVNQKASGVCIYCAACLGKDMPRTEWLRFTSFLATKDYLLRLKRDDLWDHLLLPPDPPFVFGVTYTHKKHVCFKAPVNYSQEIFFVQTEDVAIKIVPSQIQKLCKALQNWYTICKKTKAEPTWFTKQDILSGCQNFKKIEAYGMKKYFKEDKIIKPFRRTALLTLLTYALNKRNTKEDKNDKNLLLF